MIYFIIVIAVIFSIWWFEPRLFLYLYQKAAYPVYSQKMFLEPRSDYFPQIEFIEQHQDLIRNDVDKLLLQRQNDIPKAHQVDQYNAEISNDRGPGWRTFYLKVYSGWFNQNSGLCPNIYNLFRELDDVITIMISVMEAGNVIPPHQGKLQGFVRYQLPLIVPAHGICRITVGDETRDYQPGHSFIFDDINTHSVINQTDGIRVVLFLDIRKPSSALIRHIDRLLMKLLTLSPKFKQANVHLN